MRTGFMGQIGFGDAIYCYGQLQGQNKSCKYKYLQDSIDPFCISFNIVHHVIKKIDDHCLHNNQNSIECEKNKEASCILTDMLSSFDDKNVILGTLLTGDLMAQNHIDNSFLNDFSNVENFSCDLDEFERMLENNDFTFSHLSSLHQKVMQERICVIKKRRVQGLSKKNHCIHLDFTQLKTVRVFKTDSNLSKICGKSLHA